ncbi:MAG TPA: hypothetical protein VM286_01020 [Candidatus Thermoplasmatota archaeon]|nr:hypothetical protein [Candidatus Thermoplasmatota archaeon]
MASDAPLSATDAARALRDLESFEEGLSSRVGGLTCMVWGIVSAAIFVTYGLVLATATSGWFLAVLWVPWVVLGVVLTTALWRLHAISLRQSPSPRKSLLWALAMTGFFVLAFLVLHLLSITSLHHLHHEGMFHYMLVLNGLALFLIVGLVSRERGRLTAVPLLVVGAAIVVAGFLLGHADLSQAGLALSSAAIVATGYCGAGLTAFVRG